MKIRALPIPAIIRALMLCVLLGTGFRANAVISVGVDPSDNWLGWMNVSELNGTYLFGDVWAPADLSAGFNGGVVTLSPNTSIARDKAPTDAYWWQPSGEGNKLMEANFYVERTASGADDLSFTGDVGSNTLASNYSAQAFIKEFTPGWGWIGMTTAPLTPGQFTVTRQAAGAGNHLQFGFMLTGPNANFAEAARLGNVQVTAAGGNAIPEPSTLALLAMSATGLLGLRRRK